MSPVLSQGNLSLLCVGIGHIFDDKSTLLNNGIPQSWMVSWLREREEGSLILTLGFQREIIKRELTNQEIFRIHPIDQVHDRLFGFTEEKWCWHREVDSISYNSIGRETNQVSQDVEAEDEDSCMNQENRIKEVDDVRSQTSEKDS